MKIGVVREIKTDEHRVALTPAGARELVRRGHDVVVETGAGLGSAFTDDAYLAAGARIAIGRRHVGGGRAPAEGEGADRGRVRAAARRPRPLHVPPSRRRRAAHAGARRLGRRRGRLRDGGDGGQAIAASGADERGRRPPRDADGLLGAREAAGWSRHPARRRAGRAAGKGARHRRRHRRLQRRAHRGRACRPTSGCSTSRSSACATSR